MFGFFVCFDFSASKLIQPREGSASLERNRDISFDQSFNPSMHQVAIFRKYYLPLLIYNERHALVDHFS